MLHPMLPPGSGLTFRVVDEVAWREGDTRDVVQGFADAARATFLADA